MERISIKIEPSVDYLIILPATTSGTSSVESKKHKISDFRLKLQKFDAALREKTKMFDNFEICEFCQKTYRNYSRQAAYDHKRICKKFTRPKKLFCDLCTYSSNNKNHLAMHIQNHPNKCGQIFQSLKALQKHQKQKRIFKCFLCDIEFSCKLLLVKHNKTKHDEMLKCPHCPFSSIRIGLLNEHIKIHNLKFYCESCGYVTSSKQNLTNHQKTRGHGEFYGKIIEKFYCDRCEKSFPLKAKLNHHKKQVHIDEKFLTCQICDKIFSTKHNLQSHVRIVHEGIKRAKKWKCDLCPTSTENKSLMKIHMQTHLKQGRKMFTCDKCGVKRTSKLSIKHHLIKAALIECFYCGIKIRCKKVHDRHLHEQHGAGQKSWPCQTCRKVYIKKITLVKHQRTH
jgi:KRAB domain-containing zinc finger protein